MLIRCEILCVSRVKREFSENFHFWGSGAELLHMGIIPQMSLFNCNSAQNNHQWLVLCSLEVECFKYL